MSIAIRIVNNSGFSVRPPALFLIAAMAISPCVIASGDPAAGKRLTTTCTACHGQANMGSVPHLGGQSPSYVVAALRAYQDGIRTHATMRDVVRTFSDRDFKNLGAYYADPATASDNSEAVGDAPETVRICSACHGPNGAKPVAGDVPKIAGQKKPFMETVLREYRDGTRKHDVMQSMVSSMSDADISAAAEYFSKQKGLFAK